MGAGRRRFQRAPSFTKHLLTYSWSTSSGEPESSALRSALEMALRSTFSICLAARFGVKRSDCSASCAFCPRIKSMTRRAFCGDMRTWRAIAWASMEPGCVSTSAMVYAFGAGAAAGAAPPPAAAAGAPAPGTRPAAFSSAALTAWPLKLRVGANSPSLCPIICSVTYTGMNFLPLCTAIVWPIMSGTIVERRDHVFRTFFSLRAFSASTLSFRWPSTNGPFFSERAIACLFLHAAQTAPLGVPHLLKPTHRTGHTVRPRTKRTNKARAQRVRNTFDDHRPARLAQLVQHRFGWCHQLGRGFGHGFQCRPFDGAFHRARPASCGSC